MKAYILLDRSGSMGTLWGEALSSINNYVKKLKGQRMKVTVASFDSQSYDILRENVSPKDWKDITNEDATPRDCTPLYDSAGKLLDRMFADDPKKAVLVVMTDGYENASKEYTRETIKKKVEKAIKRDWGVTFLGADFDKVDVVSESVGVGTSNTVYVTRVNLCSTMDSLASKTMSYAGGGGGGSMEFTDEEKAKAASMKINLGNATVKTTVTSRAS